MISPLRKRILGKRKGNSLTGPLTKQLNETQNVAQTPTIASTIVNPNTSATTSPLTVDQSGYRTLTPQRDVKSVNLFDSIQQ